MKVLSLNLHCGQEENYDEKLKIIVKGINEMEPDLIFFQECSQPIDGEVVTVKNGITIKKGNIGYHIFQEIHKKCSHYDFYFDWGNHAFGNLEEGQMIVSKFSTTQCDSRYVSNTKAIQDWWSRKIVRVGVQIDGVSYYFYSVHLGWWEDERETFKEQLDKLLAWTKETVDACHFLAGDFNNAAGTIGYDYMKEVGLRDLYLEANPKNFYDSTFIGTGMLDLEQDNHKKRIDYLVTLNTEMIMSTCLRVYTGYDRPVVSDHCGLFAEIII